MNLLYRSFGSLLPVLLLLPGMGGCLLAAGFDDIPSFIGSASLPRDPTPHDVDGDGDLDIVYLDGNESDTSRTEIGWFENSNAGTTWTRHVLATGYRGPATLKMVDLGNDGRVDLLVGLRSGYQLLLFEHLGGSRFAPARVLRDNLFGLEDIDAADLDNDGLVDLVIASDTGPRWMRQIPGLDFAAPVAIANNLGTFSQSQAVEPHDFDGDGDIDLVIAVAHSNRLIYCRNNGNGVFAAPVNLDTSRRTYALDAGDLDGDGHIDIVSAARDFDNPEVFWLKNNGNGTFAPKRLLTTGAYDVSAVVTLDVDGDGDLDIAAALYEGPVFWLENNGGGAFLPLQRIGDGGDFMFHLTKGDLDGDGDEDLVAAQWDNDRFIWYRNTSPIPTIDPPQIDFFRADDTSVTSSATLRWQTTGAVTVEITPDVGTVAATGSRTVFLSNTQTFTITASNAGGTAVTELTIFVGEPPLIRSFVALDDTVARNSFADLSWDVAGAESLSLDPTPGTVTGSSHQPRMSQTTTFTLRAINEFGERSAIQTVEVGDPPSLDMLEAVPSSIALNGVILLNWSATGADTAFVSGVGEVRMGQSIAVRPASSRSYTVTASNDFGSASRTVNVTVSGDLLSRTPTSVAGSVYNAWEVAFADLTGDGVDDLIVGISANEPESLVWQPGLPDGGFGPATLLEESYTAPWLQQPYDMDGDGDLDLFLTSNPFRWYPNQQNATSFGPAREFPAYSFVKSPLHIGDLTGDGLPDVAGVISGKLLLIPGTPGGGLGTAQELDSYGPTYGDEMSAAADIDGDGDLDLVGVHDGEGTVFWYRNDHGIFSRRFTVYDGYPIVSGVRSIEGIRVADFDGDGFPEVIVRTALEQFSILDGNRGDFSGTSPRSIGTSLRALRTFEVVDLDLDGDLDLVLLGRSVELMENLGNNLFSRKDVFEVRTFNSLPDDFVFQDIDRDGDPDLVATHSQSIVYLENLIEAPDNAPPTHPGIVLRVPAGGSASLLVDKFLRRASDPDGDSIALVAFDATSDFGGTIVRQPHDWLYRPPPLFEGVDRFDITISDGLASVVVPVEVTVFLPTASNIGNPPVVTMTPGGPAELEFSAIPFLTYGVERTTNMIDWVRLPSAEADAQGRIVVEDPNPPMPSAIYRLVFPAQ